MLPVQTVMIRYMVLVYRWGDGWLSAVGAREGFAGGAVTGGGALAEGTRGGAFGMGAKRPRRQGGRRGLKEILIFKSLVSIGMNAKG